MELLLILAILYQLFLCSEPVSESPTKSRAKAVSEIPKKEPSFGVEFTLDHVISSVTLANGSTYGLARVPGGNTYQSLMRHYLDFCHHIHLTQDAPLEEMRQASQKAYEDERARRSRLIRRPDHSWWDYFAVAVLQWPEYSRAVFEGDEYAGDVEANVLTQAMESLKNATVQELSRRFSDTPDPFPWAYASIVTPDFL